MSLIDLGPRRCPVCGQLHTACGDGAEVDPVDLAPMEERPMSRLKRYAVTVNGYQTEMMLDDHDAEAYGAAAVPVDTSTPTTPAVDTKARRAANKTRTPAVKYDA